MLRVGLLGPVIVQAHEPVALSGPQQRRLVASLALARAGPVTTEQLVEDLWGEEPPRSARRSLQAQVSRLRRAFATAGAQGAIVRAGDGYALAGAVEVDSEEFRARASAGREALRAGDLKAAAAEFDAALGRWRGPCALADARECGAPALEARMLDEERLGVIEDRAEVALASGEVDEVVPTLLRTAAEYPLRQRVALLAMNALLRSGRATLALEVYERTRLLLREQLGITPGPELRELHAAILRETAPQVGPPPRAVPPPFELGALQLRKLKYLFRALDADGDGLLEAESFRAHADRLAALAEHDPELAADVRAHVNAWWAGVKPSGADEPASLENWLRFWGAWLAAVTRDAEADGGAELRRMKESAARTFAVMDADRDGRLHVADYERWVETWGLRFDARANFARLDVDGDGTLGEADVVQLVKEFFLSNDPEAPGNFLYGPAF
jgi:DNA-binding SARP family transcriptional activator